MRCLEVVKHKGETIWSLDIRIESIDEDYWISHSIGTIQGRKIEIYKTRSNVYTHNYDILKWDVEKSDYYDISSPWLDSNNYDYNKKTKKYEIKQNINTYSYSDYKISIYKRNKILLEYNQKDFGFTLDFKSIYSDFGEEFNLRLL